MLFAVVMTLTSLNDHNIMLISNPGTEQEKVMTLLKDKKEAIEESHAQHKVHKLPNR